MVYNSDEEEMVLERLVAVAHAIVELHVPNIYVSDPGGGWQVVHRVVTHLHRVHRSHHKRFTCLVFLWLAKMGHWIQ